ncbi:exo-alpha-sialidase [Trypanosoma cruzi]|nr:exo-alpha-sialidase [Trypanosoma cruzi]
MQRSTTALRGAYALQPVVHCCTSPHPPANSRRLLRRRASPRTAGESPAVKSTAGETRRHVQLLGRNPSALFPGTLSTTPLTGLHAATITPATSRRDKLRAPALPPREAPHAGSTSGRPPSPQTTTRSCVSNAPFEPHQD